MHAYCEKTMHMSVYGKNNHCLPTSFENLNLIFLIFSEKNEKSISGGGGGGGGGVCVFKEGRGMLIPHIQEE